MGKPTIYDVVRALESLTHVKDSNTSQAIARDLLMRIYRYDGIEEQTINAPVH